MSPEVINKIYKWCEKNNIEIDKGSLSGRSFSNKYDFLDALVCALKSGGYWRDSYEPFSPDVFLAELIGGVVSLVEEKDIKVAAVKSDDDWETASFILSDGNSNVNLKLNSVGGIDPEYASHDLPEVLARYSQEHCEKRLHMAVCQESGYVYLYVADDAIKELTQILNEIPEPDY